MIDNRLLVWLCLLSVSFSVEYILPNGKLKCFLIEPDNSDGNFIVNYKIPLGNDSIKVELRNADNYTIQKQSNSIDIVIRQPHELCFENTGDIEETVQFGVKSLEAAAQAHEIDNLTATLSNATNISIVANQGIKKVGNMTKAIVYSVDQHDNKVEIAGWIKALIVLVIIAMNASVLKCWRRRQKAV